MKLINSSKNITLIEKLERATSLYARMKGLLGRNELPSDEALMINHCSSIHTFYMKFAVDVVFVDRKMVVKKIYKNVKPWRLVSPIWGAHSVIEFAGGALEKLNIEIGDQLNVVD